LLLRGVSKDATGVGKSVGKGLRIEYNLKTVEEYTPRIELGDVKRRGRVEAEGWEEKMESIRIPFSTTPRHSALNLQPIIRPRKKQFPT